MSVDKSISYPLTYDWPMMLWSCVKCPQWKHLSALSLDPRWLKTNKQNKHLSLIIFINFQKISILLEDISVLKLDSRRWNRTSMRSIGQKTGHTNRSQTTTECLIRSLGKQNKRMLLWLQMETDPQHLAHTVTVSPPEPHTYSQSCSFYQNHWVQRVFI